MLSPQRIRLRRAISCLAHALLLVSVAVSSSPRAVAASLAEAQAGDVGVPGAPRTVPISGRVLDPAGRPVHGAHVAILSEKLLTPRTCPEGLASEGCFDRLVAVGAVRADGRSGPDGRFVVHLPGGLTNFDYFWARGEDAGGRSLAIWWPIRPNRSVTASTLGEIAMNRQREFVLFVQGDGRPVADAEVDFGNGNTKRTDQAGTTSYSVHVGDDASLRGLAFTVRANGFAGTGWAGGLPVGTTTHVVALVRETLLTGRIVDARKRPVAGAVVSARAAEAWPGVGVHTSGSTAPDETVGTTRSDAAGVFSLHGLRAAERYHLTITAADVSVGSVERMVHVDRVPIDIALVDAVPVTLAITGITQGPLLKDLQPGQAGPGIALEWLEPASGVWQAVASPRQIAWRESGRADLRFDQVPVGSVRVTVRGDYTTAGDILDLFQVVGGTRSVIPLELAQNRQVRIQVNDAQGGPVGGARVEVFAHTGRSSTYTNTGPDGSATFRVHPAHDLKVAVTVGGTLMATTVVRAASGNPDPIFLPAR